MQFEKKWHLVVYHPLWTHVVGILRQGLDTVLCFKSFFFFVCVFMKPQQGKKWIYSQKSFAHIHKGDIQPQVLKTSQMVVFDLKTTLDPHCLMVIN